MNELNFPAIKTPAIKTSAVVFPSLPALPTLASCSVDGPAAALDWLLSWQADVQVGETVLRDRPVFEVLRNLQRNPAEFGITAEAAAKAVERFVSQAGQALEAEGGKVEWLRREFER